jgi:L-seryl-tRNA(Ser) seleniumtransferase
MPPNPLRGVPAVSAVLESASVRALQPIHGHDVVADAVRVELDAIREKLKAGEALDGELKIDAIAQRVALRVEAESASTLRTVINATGIVLHTNLGRSPIAERAAKAAYDAARAYLNLELDLDDGKRSSRQNPIREVICPLLGCESATAVNNCAAATVIVLRALAAGKEVIVSRGQLVEIGGSFRIPEIMGVRALREVGTNIEIADYERAIGHGRADARHHNYRISGFTESATLENSWRSVASMACP